MIRRKGKASLPKVITWSAEPGAAPEPLVVQQRPKRKRRTRVVKTINTVSGGAWQPKQQKLQAHPLYVQATPESIAYAERLFQQLQPGGLCFLKKDLGPVDTGHPYPQLYHFYGEHSTAPVKRGATAVYAGPVECQEQTGNGQRIMHVIRHSFIVGTGRYIVQPELVMLFS